MQANHLKNVKHWHFKHNFYYTLLYKNLHNLRITVDYKEHYKIWPFVELLYDYFLKLFLTKIK